MLCEKYSEVASSLFLTILSTHLSRVFPVIVHFTGKSSFLLDLCNHHVTPPATPSPGPSSFSHVWRLPSADESKRSWPPRSVVADRKESEANYTVIYLKNQTKKIHINNPSDPSLIPRLGCVCSQFHLPLLAFHTVRSSFQQTVPRAESPLFILSAVLFLNLPLRSLHRARQEEDGAVSWIIE